MPNRQEHFCHFLTIKSRTEKNYATYQPNGFLSPRIAYITKGSCIMSKPDGVSLTLNEGDV
jgi:hypothetical protein